MKRILFLVLLVFSVASLCAQTNDSAAVNIDSLNKQSDSLTQSLMIDSIDTVKQTTGNPVFKLKNKLLNTDGEPVLLVIEFKNQKSEDAIFYLLVGLILLLAFLKYFYSRYFTNLFRVFFNTSLRQSQLTDQLLQAKLPSLLFNIFFVISAGLYLYVLTSQYQLTTEDNRWAWILSSVSLVGLVYLVKFATLKFTGWITGFNEATDTYIFVTFLINKIIGIFLAPFVIILSFSDSHIAGIASLISLMCIGVFLLLRYLRSYGLLQNQLKISKFHFILYLLGIEILPLLLIYKGLMLYLTKNL